MARFLNRNHEQDGIDRRGFLECMAWAGTGALWTVSAGVVRGQMLHEHGGHNAGLSFVQISDSHIGFHKEANRDVVATLETAVKRINALPERPAFLIHTGDISHLSKPEEFDTVDQILKTAKVGQSFFVPGEHDVLTDDGKQYRDRYGRDTAGSGWFSFDHGGAHFIGLVNVLNLKAGGLGTLGRDQLDWLKADLEARTSSTPVVVFAHMPLWTVYAEWGWGTDDGMEAISYLKRFGSVTVLNGHIHQTMQKVEGNITFHTAASTAFPQPKPGSAASPGPMLVPAEQLRSYLGMTEVRQTAGSRSLAILDSTLEEAKQHVAGQVTIDNFNFNPSPVTVAAGARVTWVNQDDIPHTIVSTDKLFASPVLDTGEQFARQFKQAGEYSYYCSIHPKMTGKVVVS